jgi:hypothetical protein
MLQLGGIETERPKIISFDPNCPIQKSEADAELNRLLGMGFLLDMDFEQEGELRLKPPPKDERVSVMRILSENGDDRLTWDREKPNEVKDAYKKFKDFLKKGYKAFIATASGKKGHSIDEFDPLAEEIIMVPSTMPG